jgi:putative transcriptional regulator
VSRRFNIPRQSREASGEVAPGNFLIASPGLHATAFDRAVVFVLQHNDDGTFGAVINRPADNSMVTSWSKQTGLEFAQQSIVQGGPLGGPVLALHQDKPLAEVEISGGVCLSVDTQAFKKLSDQHESVYRIVLGIAGWEQKQLLKEMALGYWYHLAADPMHIFDDHASMWENFVREFGRQSLLTFIDERHFPQNPTWN